MKRLLTAALLTAMASAVTACGSTRTERVLTGAGIGALAGVGVGALLGPVGMGTGALVGGAAGAGVGYGGGL
jgi:hypothetical protein